MNTAPQVPADDETQEKFIVGGAVVLALVVGLGFAAQKQGLLDAFFGQKDVVKVAAALVAVLHKEAGGDPQRILMSGFVVDEREGKAIEASLKRAFPGSEIKNAVRVDAGKQPNKLPAKKDAKKGTVRLSFAADAVNEAWPRARFGDIRRLEMVWKEEQLTVRGSIFSSETKSALEKAFASIAKKNQGVLQLRDVVRPVVPMADLQNQISTVVAGRAIAFDKEGVVDANDAVSKEVLAAVAPLLKNLQGLDVWISAGNEDRAVSLKQAEAVKAALVAGGADALGLRAVPAAKNNPFSLVVREKD